MERVLQGLLLSNYVRLFIEMMENVWHLRRVADTASKACFICYKPSASVLITPDSKDFFYVCPSHLKDSNFCTPSAAEAAVLAEKKKQEELDGEIEKIKQEYELKKKKKQEKRQEKNDKDKTDSKDKDKKKADQESDAKDEKEQEEKITALTSKQDAKADTEPRIFVLKKYVIPLDVFATPDQVSLVCRIFYQMRLDKMRNAERAKRDRERLLNPTTFPSVPSGLP